MAVDPGPGRRARGHLRQRYTTGTNTPDPRRQPTRRGATVPESSESRFFDVEYRIPPELARGKQKVIVRFQAADGSETAPIFGVRIIRLGA